MNGDVGSQTLKVIEETGTVYRSDPAVDVKHQGGTGTKLDTSVFGLE
jgi:hypothetical protein